MWARNRSWVLPEEWWAGEESNLYSRRRLIYSQLDSPPVQPTHETCQPVLRRVFPRWRADFSVGADDGTRTRNRRFTKPLLYQLSYVGRRKGTLTLRPLGARE